MVELGERDPEGLNLGAQRAVLARHNVRSAQRHTHAPYEFIRLARECALVRIPYGEDHLGGEKRPPLCEQRLELLLRLLRALLGRHGCGLLLLHRCLPFLGSAAQPQAHADACANARAQGDAGLKHVSNGTAHHVAHLLNILEQVLQGLRTWGCHVGVVVGTGLFLLVETLGADRRRRRGHGAEGREGRQPEGQRERLKPAREGRRGQGLRLASERCAGRSFRATVPDGHRARLDTSERCDQIWVERAVLVACG